MMGNKISALEYALALDIRADIRDHKETLGDADRTKLNRLRDYSAFSWAHIQRYLPPAIGLLGLEEILAQGRLEQGAVKVAAAASAIVFDVYLRIFGTNVSRAHAVIDYLTGKDVTEYVKVYEPLVRKMAHRVPLSKVMDYWIHLRSYIYRFGYASLEVHGMMKVFNADYIQGVAEVGVGIYKNFGDYRTIQQRRVWLGFHERVKKSGALPDITGNVDSQVDLKSGEAAS
ncbi:hypothetical protein HYX09_02300 [Candidatus Woesearchaeota archaeon]|nr:hypothetical protein [Candidatus Woesearchaeota archaeon]MBI2661079.1 hypothetical protein [Candidatus Woesearchaeota archaeon]